MRILRHFTGLGSRDTGSVVAIGNFDGVHRGHRAVIDAAARIARASGADQSVLTFEPHPRSVFQPDIAPFRVTPFRSKARQIEMLGVDILFALHFDLDFSHHSAEDFVREVLVEGLAVSHVVVGADFVFGNRRRGTPEFLAQEAPKHGFSATFVEPVIGPDGLAYSSTRIRELLGSGRPAEAAALLGRYFEIEGRVETGDRRGRTIGFPTANVGLADYLRPAAGVYAIRAGLDRPAGGGGPSGPSGPGSLGSEVQTVWFDGVANLGRRPTFGGDDLLLEAHLFDFAEDLYGQHLRVALIEYLRPETRFDGIDALKAQIAEDATRARELLATHGPAPAGGERVER